MKVNKTRDSITNKLLSADITGLTGEDYVEIMLTLRLRQEYLEQQIDECNQKEHLQEFIPNKEKELLQVNKLIKNMGV